MAEVLGMDTETRRAGRPALPEGEARTSCLRTMVRPASEARFIEVAKANGMSKSDALRQAAADWVKKHGNA